MDPVIVPVVVAAVDPAFATRWPPGATLAPLSTTTPVSSGESFLGHPFV